MKLGQKVKCSGYLKKQKKRYCLPAESILTKEQLEIASVCNPIYLKLMDEIEQENYKVIFCEENKEFEGIIVGKQNINLYTHYVCDSYDNGNITKYYIQSFLAKECAIPCYKVYYRLGKSRLVPVNMVEVEDE